MDGVIYNMMGELVTLAKTRSAQKLFDFDDTSITEKPGVWNISESWGMRSNSQFWKFFYWAVGEGLFLEGKPIEGAIQTVGNFVDSGHRVRIVTSKQFSDSVVAFRAQTDVIEWLYSYAPLWSNKVEVAFTGNKQGYEADVIIDDKPTLAWAQLDKVNVLFDHSWNTEINANPVGMYPMQPHLYRAESWEQVEYLVGRVSTGKYVS